MGSLCKPDTLFDFRTYRNGMRPEDTHFKALDTAQDRLATGARRMAIPASMGRGQDNDYWTADTDWKHTITIPAYTKGVGVVALCKVQKASNKALNAALFYGPDGSDWDHYLTFTQDDQGLPAASYSDDALALALPWVWTEAELVTTNPNSPMPVTVSNEPQTIPIYLKCDSDITYQILAYSLFAVPYRNELWPDLP